ncbi:MAG: NBR1-Ig-like domain-containing protein [Anaerolineales bacterium]
MPKIKLTLIMIIIAITLAACGGNQAAQTPTVSVSEIQTLAVSAFISGLTETAQVAPTEIPANTPTLATTNTASAFNTLVPLNGSGTPIAAVGSPTASCYGLLYVSDVSIPDDTKMQPGKKFTKTWLVQNTGGCAWQAGFKWTLISGDPMGGSTVTLTQTVNPGDQFQISVPMIAPTTAGEATGTWKMADANGTFFGQSMWVKIVVENPSATDTPASTDTPEVITATP